MFLSVRSCGHPGDAQFADFRLQEGLDFVFGSRVVYTCNKGYTDIYDSFVFSFLYTSCALTVLNLCSVALHEVLHFPCYTGFRYEMVSRTNQRRCLVNGWDGVVPVCQGRAPVVTCGVCVLLFYVAYRNICLGLLFLWVTFFFLQPRASSQRCGAQRSLWETIST